MQLTYAIKYVADMDKAVAFHRDVLGLPLKFQSPEWTEFATGDTTLALHSATPEKVAGSVELGFASDDLGNFYARRDDFGVEFASPPTEMHGMHIAQIRDSEGAGTSISGPA
jgi:lactoylglutathione lyase